MICAQALIFSYSLRRLAMWIHRLNYDLLHPLPLKIDDPESVEPLQCPSIFDPASKTLSVVIPAYNEEDRLATTLDETLAYLQQRYVLLP